MHSRDLLGRPYRFFILKYWPTFVIGLTALFITNTLDASWPYFLKIAIDQISQNAPFTDFQHTCILFFSVISATALFRFLWRIFFGRFHHTIANDLRGKIYDHYLYLPPRYFQKTPVGELMSLITSDVNSFRMSIGPAILILMDAFSMMAVIIPIMWSMSHEWTFKCLILMPILPFVIRKVMNLIHKGYKIQQDRLAELSGLSQEIVSGIRTIKNFAQEDTHLKIYNKKSVQYESACNYITKVDSMFEPIMQFGVAVGSVILLYVTSQSLNTQTVTVGTLIAFHRYIQRMIWPMTAIGMGISDLQKGKASFHRIRQLLQTESDVPDTGKEILQKIDSIEIKDLNFRYKEDRPLVLKNINLKIFKNEKLGIVGAVGSGKSTLVQLLCRLYSVAENTILINKKTIENFQLESLRKAITLIPQEPFLFSETIAENLTIDKNIKEQSINNILKTVNMDREVLALPAKMHTALGERGVNLSGGQKQRLCIARGLLHASDVVILDDSLSAVDAKTDQLIQEAIRTELNDRTVIVISHRVSTVMQSARIVVLNNGEIEAMGSHKELLSTSATYQRLCELQGVNE